MTSWTFQSGGASFSAPVIAADGTIYATASDGRLHAVDSKGMERWSAPADNGGGSKNFATAAIAKNGSIYVGNGESLESIDAAGNTQWSLPATGVVYTSPAIGSDGTVYFTAADDRLHAATADGKEIWATPTPGAGTGSGQPSSPAIGLDGTIYVVDTVFSPGSATGNLFAVRPDGSVRWETPVGAYFLFGPVVGEDGTVFVGTASWLRAVAPDGTVRWTTMENLGVASAPAVGDDGTLYVFDAGFEPKLYALGMDGTQKWAIPAASSTQPVLGNDGALLLTNGSAVFTVLPDGTMSSPATGGASGGSPPAVASDGTLVFASGTSLVARSPKAG